MNIRELNIKSFSNLHEAGYKCTLFANIILNQIKLLIKKTHWQIDFAIPFLIIYIALKLEILTLVKNLGLFNIYKKEFNEIVNRFILIVSGNTSFNFNKKYHNTIDNVEILSTLELLINRNFKDFIHLNGSVISNLILNLLKYLNDNKLWEKWSKILKLNRRINLVKIFIHLEYLYKYTENIETSLLKILDNTLQRFNENESDIFTIYNLCFTNIFKINKTFKIRRNRTYTTQTFYYNLEENINIKFKRKNLCVSQDLFFPYPSTTSSVWQFERITVDFVKINNKYYIKSISSIPTKLKKITQWKYNNFIKQFFINLKKYYRSKFWHISAYLIIILGIIFSIPQIFIQDTTVIGGILLFIGGALISPVLSDYYLKYKSKEKVKMGIFET